MKQDWQIIVMLELSDGYWSMPTCPLFYYLCSHPSISERNGQKKDRVSLAQAD